MIQIYKQMIPFTLVLHPLPITHPLDQPLFTLPSRLVNWLYYSVTLRKKKVTIYHFIIKYKIQMNN